MTNRLLTFISFFLLLTSCRGQADRSSNLQECNRQVYGTKKYIQNLPAYICIPKGFVIDDYVRFADLEGDGKNDFLAVKYNKKEDDQTDGDLTYWDFYTRNQKDTIYILKYSLTNLVPPFIKDVGLDYVTTHPVAQKIFDTYPRRMNHDLSFQVKADTIRLSYKFEDSYGKTFVFVYDQLKENWYLKNVEYFIGELPMSWWQEDKFYYPLNDAIKVIETRRPKKEVSIQEFDLREGFKYREKEWVHLADWHVDRIDKKSASSILDVKFQKCQGIGLPANWYY